MQIKRKLFFLAPVLAFVIMVNLVSCDKKSSTAATDPLAALSLPDQPYNYANPGLPNYLSSPQIIGQDNTTPGNSITDWGATLGRVIFYDRTVSINNKISCANCHKQELGFSDTAVLSKGFDGGNTGRHSMTLINARYYPGKKFFWDERAATLEVQVLTPIQDPIEMGMNLDTLVKRFQSTTHYPYLFQKAFGDAQINSDRISKALAQFVRSIVSYQSRFDAGRATVAPGADPFQTPYSNFTAIENQGKQLFFSPITACNTCHGTETFTAPGDRNNGIENPSIDQGVGGKSGIAQQIGNFKVPSLKNIAMRAPYMHDGRFKTLEQVIEHYNSGIQANPNLAPQLRNPDGSPRRMNLTTDQKAALVAFLNTLTDEAITKETRFANPFK